MIHIQRKSVHSLKRLANTTRNKYKNCRPMADLPVPASVCVHSAAWALHIINCRPVADLPLPALVLCSLCRVGTAHQQCFTRCRHSTCRYKKAGSKSGSSTNRDTRITCLGYSTTSILAVAVKTFQHPSPMAPFCSIFTSLMALAPKR